MSFSKSCTLSAGNLLAVAQLLNGPDSESNCNAQLQYEPQRQSQQQRQHQLQSQPQTHPQRSLPPATASLQASPDPLNLLVGLLLSFWHFLARRLSLVAALPAKWQTGARLPAPRIFSLIEIYFCLLLVLMLLLRFLVNVCMHFPLASAPTHCANAFGTFTSQLTWR